MARKKKHEEHENLERWLVSYADFITLLFAFFVVMYSLSAINEGKFRVLAESLAAAFRSLPRSHEPIQLGQVTRSVPENATQAPPALPITQVVNLPLPPLPAPRPPPGAAAAAAVEGARAMQEMAARLEQTLAPLIEKKLIVVRRSQFWLEVEIKTNILFPSGSAELVPAIVPVLENIAVILRDYPNPVRVEGFTDNVPINTPAYPSNWELSAARAARVVRLFAAEGVTPLRLAAVGHGEYKPVAPNDNEDGRSRNRRVVIVVMTEEASRIASPESRVASGEKPRESPGPGREDLESQTTSTVASTDSSLHPAAAARGDPATHRRPPTIGPLAPAAAAPRHGG